MAGFRIEGNTSGNVAEVNSSNEIKVALSNTAANIGGAKIVTDNGQGGGVTNIGYPLSTPDKRLSVGTDTLLFSDEFTAAAQNTAIWKQVASSATIGYNTGWVIINSGNSGTIDHRSAIETYRTFSLINRASMCFEAAVMLIDAALPASGLNYYVGLTPTNTTTPGTPKEGVFFHISPNGIDAKISSDGATVASINVLASGSLQQDIRYKLSAIYNYSKAWFFIDDVLVGVLNVPLGVPQPGVNTSCPFSVSHYNSTAVAGTVARLKVGNVGVYMMDAETSKPWSHIMAGQGMHCSQAQNGATMGKLSYWPRDAALQAAATLTSTTAAVQTGTTNLGGIWRTNGVAAQNVDGIIFAYQIPVAATNFVPYVLYVTGIRVQAAITAAATGGPIVYAYALHYGHTALSLATAEAATTKSPRTIILGMESLSANGAAFSTNGLGAIGQGVYVPFVSPVVVNPGEYISVTARNCATVLSAGEVTFTVMIDGYYE